MTFPILGGNGAVAGYSIDNSLRFNDGDSAYLTRTPSTPTSNDIGTFSFWFKKTNVSDLVNIVGAYDGSANNSFDIQFHSDDRLRIRFGNTALHETSTSQLFRDVSAWYHVLFAIDTTQATASNRIKFYVNGTQITDFNATSYPAQNLDCLLLTGNSHKIGTTWNAGGNMLDGYLADVYLIDGQALSPTDFGEFDEDSGIWKPIEYTGTFGNNGYYLDFENSGSLGADQSGNGNNFTPTNLASTDQTTDTPTNNFATFNSTIKESGTLSEGNLKSTGDGSSPSDNSVSTMGANTGKWYAEFELTTDSTNSTFGICDEQSDFFDAGNNIQVSTVNGIGMRDDGNMYNYGTENSSWGTSFTTNDILQIALDMDNGYVYFGKNGTWMNSGVPTSGSSGTGGVSITNTDRNYFMFVGESFYNATPVWSANFGNPSFSITSGNTDDNGYGNFEYAPPSGYLALCTQNLATELSPTIDDGSQYFNSVLYSGDGTSDQDITGVGFKPDWVWLKARSSAYNHRLYDSTRGALKNLQSNSNSTELTATNGLISFDTDGFSVSQGGDEYNASGQNYVSWSWKANGGTTSSNTDGSITSTVQANTTAGFSVVTYAGNDTNGATVGHGLGKSPKMIILKNRTFNDSWIVYHEGIGNTQFLHLDATGAASSAVDFWQSTTPSSSVFTIYGSSGGRWINSSSDTYVAYCFAEIEGYSKFGSYTGNGSSDGTFVYTGFRPAFVIVKCSSSSQSGAAHWIMYDVKRNTYNVVDELLYANLSNDESANDSSRPMDILSNGFKLKGSGTGSNASGATYIYMCFSANPFVTSSGVPVVAR